MFYRQSRANLGYVSNAEKFRCLYSYYGSCMPSSPKEYIRLALIGPNKVACAPGVV